MVGDATLPSDEEAAELEAFLLALGRHFKDRDFTTAEVVQKLETTPDLEQHLPEDLAQARAKQTSLAKRLGRAFARIQERRYGETEVRVVDSGKAGHARKWRIVANLQSGGLVPSRPIATDPHQEPFEFQAA
jgi:hypothetical protein